MDTWKVGPVELKSRLILGSGKYEDFGVMREAIAAAKAEVVTVSVRRVELKAPGHVGLLEALEGVRLLPNTAGARTAEEAVRLARLGRLLTGERWVKLEVIPDPTYLLPDPLETLKAAERLIEEDFLVLPYMGPDLVLAKRLAALGTATVMPLAAPIGSGWGVRTRALLELFAREKASLPPVVVDAGLGLPSHAAEVMELGLDAVLVNTAIAEAQDPPAMAEAFRLAVEAGRKAYLAGPMRPREAASPSSPVEGVPLPRPGPGPAGGPSSGGRVMRADVAVVGAGIIGALAAYELAKRGWPWPSWTRRRKGPPPWRARGCSPLTPRGFRGSFWRRGYTALPATPSSSPSLGKGASGGGGVFRDLGGGPKPWGKGSLAGPRPPPLPGPGGLGARRFPGGFVHPKALREALLGPSGTSGAPTSGPRWKG